MGLVKTALLLIIVVKNADSFFSSLLFIFLEKLEWLWLKCVSDAPEFSLCNQDDETVKKSDYADGFVLLRWYPKADTPVWTIEGNEFRNRIQDFKNRNALVVGVSYDDQAANSKFRDKYSSPSICSAKQMGQFRLPSACLSQIVPDLLENLYWLVQMVWWRLFMSKWTQRNIPPKSWVTWMFWRKIANVEHGEEDTLCGRLHCGEMFKCDVNVFLGHRSGIQTANSGEKSQLKRMLG